MGYVTLSRVTGTRRLNSGGVALSFGRDGNHCPSAKRFVESSVCSAFDFWPFEDRVCYNLDCYAFLRGVPSTLYAGIQLCMLTVWVTPVTELNSA